MIPPSLLAHPSSIDCPPETAITLPAPIPIGGVPVHPVGVDEMLAWITSVIAEGARARVSYANAYNVLLAQDDPAYRTAIESTDMVFCDGFGVWGASRWLGTPLPERMTLPDWSERLFALAETNQWPLYFLGAERGIAERAATHLLQRFPRLAITTHHGYFDLNGKDNERILDEINAAAPTLLFVGMGPPRQDVWMHANQHRHTAALTLAVGCLFDYLAGTRQRGPRWMTRTGGEWVWRLAREPRRLWRRYLVGNPRFLWHIWKHRAARSSE